MKTIAIVVFSILAFSKSFAAVPCPYVVIFHLQMNDYLAPQYLESFAIDGYKSFKSVTLANNYIGAVSYFLKQNRSSWDYELIKVSSAAKVGDMPTFNCQ